jgi:hypothetical protein
VIAFGAATVYFVASGWLPLLVDQWVISGVMYGVLVYFFMQWVVLCRHQGHPLPVFLANDVDWRRDSYFLCRAADCRHGAVQGICWPLQGAKAVARGPNSG